MPLVSRNAYYLQLEHITYVYEVRLIGMRSQGVLQQIHIPDQYLCRYSTIRL
jgi:hypothetical protein